MPKQRQYMDRPQVAISQSHHLYSFQSVLFKHGRSTGINFRSPIQSSPEATLVATSQYCHSSPCKASECSKFKTKPAFFAARETASLIWECDLAKRMFKTHPQEAFLTLCILYCPFIHLEIKSEMKSATKLGHQTSIKAIRVISFSLVSPAGWLDKDQLGMCSFLLQRNCLQCRYCPRP